VTLQRSPLQLGLAVGASGWTLGGGEYDPAGISEYVLSDDGTGAQRRWRVRVPLELDPDGFLVAGDPIVEEIG
jgi:hypothetical protein